MGIYLYLILNLFCKIFRLLDKNFLQRNEKMAEESILIKNTGLNIRP